MIKVDSTSNTILEGIIDNFDSSKSKLHEHEVTEGYPQLACF